MDSLVDLFIVILAGLVHASLQLGISSLLILYHASLGKNIKKQTKFLTRNFMVGFSLFTALTVASACFVILVVFSESMPIAAKVILIGILIAMALAMWTIYYRRSTGTELWIPRSFARFINERAEKTSDEVEAFSLGMLMSAAEMPFGLILVLVAADSILGLPQSTQILGVIVYVACAIFPMLLLQLAVTNGKTIVDIQKWRVKNKNFIKIMSGVGYITLAIFLIAFKIMKDF